MVGQTTDKKEGKRLAHEASSCQPTDTKRPGRRPSLRGRTNIGWVRQGLASPREQESHVIARGHLVVDLEHTWRIIPTGFLGVARPAARSDAVPTAQRRRSARPRPSDRDREAGNVPPYALGKWAGRASGEYIHGAWSWSSSPGRSKARSVKRFGFDLLS
ncbi:hypothetical protein PVAP13_1KG185654 [Panicum virgatum]|uniref:Uncharacterized protein n=1 Tax=Panicum virgatum TaxID=38727 RepID=A0A8T0XB02_PANVG|nr:hypothetical protein PVAP13_1KG185654 [Panicum virgatum]